MKITVKIGTVEVVVDRPNFKDTLDINHQEKRVNILEDTIIPTLNEAIGKVKELYNLQKGDL